VQKLWDRGLVLASLLAKDPIFPKRLVLKGPTSGEMAINFEDVRIWINELRAMPHCRVCAAGIQTPGFWRNAVPHEA